MPPRHGLLPSIQQEPVYGPFCAFGEGFKVRPQSGNDLDLGLIVNGGGKMLRLPRELRDKHLYVAGGTGVGKSKFLEHLIRQDILNWRKSRCGLIVLDPHGSLYDGLMSWLAWHNLDRPIIPIDLRRDDWVVAYNVVRERKVANPAVIVDNIIEAMAHVWGQVGTDHTPLFARWAANILRVLYEKRLTLVEAIHLIDRSAADVLDALTSGLDDPVSQRDWDLAKRLNAKDFEAQVSSTVNRLQRFIRNENMRAIFGHADVSLDLGTVLEEGGIILVSLAREGARVSAENADLFATLLLNDLWTAAQERGKRKGVRPFYVYLDEFQRFVTPTIAQSLDEARGFGLRLTMAHQFPNQLLDGGVAGKRLYDSVMENASSKVVFRLTHEDNLRPLAMQLFRGVMNPDEIKHELYSTKVLEYREEMRRAYGYSTTRGHSVSSGGTCSTGGGTGGSASHFENYSGAGVTAESWNAYWAETYGESESSSEATTESESFVPTLVPVLGQELSHVQFRSLEEQQFRAMAVLFDQIERQCVARLVGTRAPVSLFTPTVKEGIAGMERIERYVRSCLEKLPFALTMDEARGRLAHRESSLASEIIEVGRNEPVVAKRRLT